MGLTNHSVGMKAVDSGLVIKKKTSEDKVIALAGNPNVGKSTVFNGLTGMNQHTGNWPGKTVTNAQGYCGTKKHNYIMVDLPGTYSLMAHSVEEEIARNFICFGDIDAVMVVCDATCLERNLNLVLQTIEMTPNVVVCVNLMDEAKRKGIHINLPLLSERLGVPVIGTTARKKKSLCELLRILDAVVAKDSTDVRNTIPDNPCLSLTNTNDHSQRLYQVTYEEGIEKAIAIIEPSVAAICCNKNNSRWLSLKLLQQDESLMNEISYYLGDEFIQNEKLQEAVHAGHDLLTEYEIVGEDARNDRIVSTLVKSAEEVCKDVIVYENQQYDDRDRKLDRLLTSRLTGYPVMVLLLVLVFWLTITGANYPSGLLSDGLFLVQDKLTDLFELLHAPDWLHGVLVLGVYRVLAWVVSVMLPPMAIFFPLFTLLEDAGYLPRVAYNLDKSLKRCHACGKQALCMCMGFGCNAAGIIGCRIIDSKRERMLAILTNNFVPCNGRFPTLIAILTMFFIGTSGGVLSSIGSALLLTLIIVFGIVMTFLVTKVLSRTLLRGMPSSFTLELPPYRKPQLGKVIVRSIFDRTLFVLGRAIVVAAPAGLVIWIMANVTINQVSILDYCASFLDPFASLMGLDGVILLAFILGFPANEIVVPIIIMGYMASGSILELDSLWEMKQLFVENGWTFITAVSTMLFSLNHWPCSTTLLTIKKETGSLKWTALAAAIPTIIGIILCIIFTTIARLFLT